jgi:endonuclease III
MSPEVRFAEQTAPVEDFVVEDRRSAAQRRSGDTEAIFRRFAAALLERNVSGASYFRRIGVFEREFGDPRSLTREHAEAMLRESGYRYPSTGGATLLDIARALSAAPFSWSSYLGEAEAKWESGFEDDPLKQIKGVGDKTRDFALSEFSDYYCAPDLHVCRMMARTGLILHGCGDPAISTVDYGFVRSVIGKLARSTGWPDARDALSPAHIDRMFWYYGQDRNRCSADPRCATCPANDLCLTGCWRGRHNKQGGEL